MDRCVFLYMVIDEVIFVPDGNICTNENLVESIRRF